MLANTAARRVRACLEEVIDSDIVMDAIDQCRKTLKEGEKIPLKERAVKMLLEFEANFHVVKSEIELRLGNALEAISENQFASLRRIYKSLADGVGKKEDYFKPVPEKPQFGAGETAKGDNGQSAQPAAGKSETAIATPAQGAPSAEGNLAPSASPAPATQPALAPAAEPQPASGGGYNPLKGIRALCKMSSIEEGQLLSYLSAIGETDGSFSTLEEVHMVNPALLTVLAENWQTHAPKIKGK
jgi:hypothetical protein